MSNPGPTTRSKVKQGSTETAGGDSMEGVASTSSSNTYNFVNTTQSEHDDGFELVKTKATKK